MEWTFRILYLEYFNGFKAIKILKIRSPKAVLKICVSKNGDLLPNTQSSDFEVWNKAPFSSRNFPEIVFIAERLEALTVQVPQ